MMSTVSSPSGDGPEAVRSGADLRAARERLGWELPDVAASLRIALPHLEALEDGRISALPGTAYAVGYVRSYAAILGLDAEEMVRRFKAEASDVSRKTDLTFPVPMPDRGLPAGAVMLVGVLLCVFAYVGWYRLSGEGRLPAEALAPIPERLAPLAQQALPPTSLSTPIASPAPAPTPVVVAANSVAPPAGTSQSMSAPADSAPAPMRADPAPAVQPISPSSAAAALVRDPAVDALTQDPDKSRILLRATADAWIQVKDRSGNLLLNRILKAGETWPVPRQDNLLLTTGNAGGTEIVVDGATAPSLGGPGAVRRDVILDPTALSAGLTAGKPATPPVQFTAMHGHQ